jgi:predicted PurR-regulated permease PerM
MNRYITWCLIFLAIFAILYLSRGILMPFIVSLVISYMLSPLALMLETRFGMNRMVISGVLILILLVLFISLWVVLIPLIYDQIYSFIENIPKYKEIFNTEIMPYFLTKIESINASYVMKIQDKLTNFIQFALEDFVMSSHKVLKSGFVVISFLSMIVLVPLISFYLIKDWKSMTDSIMNLVPQRRQSVIKELVKEINFSLASFFRGQLNVCLMLSCYYSVALLLVGLNYGMFIGIATGCLSFIPFLGLLGGFFSSVLVAYFQFKSWYSVFIIVAVFLLGNILEGIISPRIIGKRLGLHPVWVIFFVLFGGSLFGVFGILFAVPCGAVVSVFIRFFIKHYYNSELYKKP